MVTFEEKTFTECQHVVFESTQLSPYSWNSYFHIIDLPKLHTLSFFACFHTFKGDSSKGRNTIINGCNTFRNTLTMKSN